MIKIGIPISNLSRLEMDYTKNIVVEPCVENSMLSQQTTNQKLPPNLNIVKELLPQLAAANIPYTAKRLPSGGTYIKYENPTYYKKSPKRWNIHQV
jgi:hypothetical protein